MERNHAQRSGEFSTMIRNIFRHSPKNKVSHLNKEMTNLSTVLIESTEPTKILPNITNNDSKHEICLVSDSPHYIVRVRLIHIYFFYTIKTFIFKIAGLGNVEEFERLIRNDPSKLKVTNTAGLCAAHNAAIRNRVAILALIVQYNGGN